MMNARTLNQNVTQDQLKRLAPAVFAEQEKETLSDKYLYIPTFKLIEGLEKSGFKVVGAKQARTKLAQNKEFAKHVVYMTHSDMNADLSKYLVAGTHNKVDAADEIPMLALTNSHNGGSSFQIDSAFYRLVCSNGLMMPSGELNSARIVHKVGMEHDVINAAYTVVKQFPELVANVNEMKQIALNDDERMFLAEAARNMVFEQDQIELNKSLGIDLRTKLLKPRRWSDNGQDLWQTFNVIQENVIKGGLRVVSENDKGQRRLAKTRPVGAIDRDAKLNKELMALALKMKELKGA